MPTKEQLESALVNADKAGDVAAAKALANALKRGEFDQTRPQEAGPRNWYDPIRSVLQGATLGFSDEIGAGIAAVPASIQTGKPYGEVYSNMHSQLGRERRQYRGNHPGESMALEAAGGVSTGLASGAKVLGSNLARNAPQWLRTAGVGAAEGGIYGAGSSSQGERVKGTVAGGATGAVLAPVAGAAMSGAGKVLAPVARAFKEHMTYTPKTQAVDVLRKVADDAGLSVDDIVNQYNKLGDDAALVDVDENFRGLMRALSDRSGTAKREARAVIESRQMGNVDRLVSTIERTTGRKAGEFVDTVKSLKAERNAKAEPFYSQSWTASPSEAMLDLAKNRPSIKAALTRGIKLAADEGEDISQSTFKQFHYAKMALDDSVGKALRAGNNNHARILINAKNQLLTEMDKASDAYRQARNLYAGDSELLNAATKGQDLFKMRPDEIDDIVSGFGDSEKALFRHGAVKAIVDKLEDSQLTHDNARKLVNSKSMQRKLSTLFDSPDDLRAFITQAMREREFTRTRQVVAGGSPTSQNTQMQKQLDDYAAQAFSFLDGAKGGVISAVLTTLKGKPITPETIDQAARVLLDNGITERQIRDIFTRAGIIQGVQAVSPVAGNALRGATVPAVTSAHQE